MLAKQQCSVLGRITVKPDRLFLYCWPECSGMNQDDRMERLLTAQDLAEVTWLALQTIYNRHSIGGSLPDCLNPGGRRSSPKSWSICHQLTARTRLKTLTHIRFSMNFRTSSFRAQQIPDISGRRMMPTKQEVESCERCLGSQKTAHLGPVVYAT